MAPSRAASSSAIRAAVAIAACRSTTATDGASAWIRRTSASTTRGSGRKAQTPASQCGDVLVRDRHGNWTYQFAVTVDDWRQGIDLVVRGMDLLSSTGRQIHLARLLGRERPPVFLHHQLIRAATSGA